MSVWVRRARGWVLFLAVVCLGLRGPAAGQESRSYDVVVVGGTPAGITAAVAAARLGERVLLVERTGHLGGVVCGGLTASDVGRFSTVGGLSREFFDRVLAYYSRTYGAASPQVNDCRGGTLFEPHVAERIFGEMVAAEPGITLRLRHRLAQVERVGDRIAWIGVDDLASGRRVRCTGALYVDATYEGDLLAGAGVACRVGREGKNEYQEPHGLGTPQRPGDPDHGDRLIQAYNLRLCLTRDPQRRVPVSRPEGYDPKEYELLRQHVAEGGREIHFSPDLFNAVALPNGKVDANAGHNAGQTSDFVGANYDYPTASWTRREAIERAHLRYVQGLLYFIQNDPAIPEALRAEASEWGLARDEFEENGHWPHQLYIREARRMVGAYVFREQDATTDRYKEDSVGLGSYPIDMHTVERHTSPTGRVWMGGGLSIHGIKPYEIPYRVLLPKEVANLLAPVCVSATNIGYATLRMEPVYMILGHAAGTAAHLARVRQVPVQDVPVPELQRLLLQAKQILRANHPPVAGFTVDPPGVVRAGEPVRFADTSTDDQGVVARQWDFEGSGHVDSTAAQPVTRFALTKTYRVMLRVKDADGDWSEPAWRDVQVVGGAPAAPEMVLDNDRAQFTGDWPASAVMDGFLGKDYRHDGDREKGKRAARYTFALPTPGRYSVGISYAPQTNRASNALVVIHHRGGEARVRIDQRARHGFLPFEYVGTYPFEGEAVVEIRNDDADGFVVADAVRLTYAGPEQSAGGEQAGR